MNLLNKLTLNNLKLNKKRTIVTIIGIMLSVALIAAVATMYASGLKSIIQYEKIVKGNFHLAYYDVKKEDIKTIQSNVGVEDVFLTSNIGYAKLDGCKNENKPYAFLMGFDTKSMENLSITLVEGKLPENDTEIIIPTHLDTNGRLKYNVGDTITLNVGDRVSGGVKIGQDIDLVQTEGNEEIINTTEKTFTIVGKMQRPSNNVECYSAPGYTFITYLNEDNMNDIVNVYTLYTKDGSKNFTKVTADILGVDSDLFKRYVYGEIEDDEEYTRAYIELSETSKYQYNANVYLLELEINPIAATNLEGLEVVVYIVCAIIVLTSVICIRNSFDISISEKIKQYGMLRSIGATKRQIRKNVLFEATILGLIGIPLGLLLGFAASYILIIVSNNLLSGSMVSGFKLVLSYSVISYIAAALLGAITVYLSALKSAYKASKVSPIESIRNSANIKIKQNKIKAPRYIKKLFGVGGEISYKNIKRNKKKYRVTVFSIIVSVSVFIALTYFMNSFMQLITLEISPSEYNYVYRIDTYESEDTLHRTIKDTAYLDGINNVTILRQKYYEINDPSYNDNVKEEYSSYNDYSYVSVIAVGEKEYKSYINELGLKYDKIKDKGILIDNIKYDNDNAKVKSNRIYKYNTGDKLSINTETNTISVTIGAISDFRPFALSYYSQEAYLLVSDEYLEENFDYIGYYEVYINADNTNEVQDTIEEMLGENSFTSNNVTESQNSSKRLVVLIGIFLYGFIIVISLIGITNIFNTITTNMQLRKPEFATLRSVGMTQKEFNKMIRLESIFMCVRSLLFGLPIGIILSYIIYLIFTKPEGVGFILPINAILITCVFVFALIYLLMAYSIHKIKKHNTIETIRNENI